MIKFFEYNEYVVEMGLAPGPLCCIHKNVILGSYNKMMLYAERAYEVNGNTLTEYKNRNGTLSTMYISDEDKLVLALRAVLLYDKS